MKSTMEEVEKTLQISQTNITNKIVEFIFNDDEILDDFLAHPIYSKFVSWFDIFNASINKLNYSEKLLKYISYDLQFMFSVLLQKENNVRYFLTNKQINLTQKLVENIIRENILIVNWQDIISSKYMSENVENYLFNRISCFYSIKRYDIIIKYINGDKNKLSKLFNIAIEHKNDELIKRIITNLNTNELFDNSQLFTCLIRSNIPLEIQKLPSKDLELQFVKDCVEFDNTCYSNLIFPSITFTNEIIDVILKSNKRHFVLCLTNSLSATDPRLTEFFASDGNENMKKFFILSPKLHDFNLENLSNDQIFELNLNNLIQGDQPSESELEFIKKYITNFENKNDLLIEKFKKFENWHKFKEIAKLVLGQLKNKYQFEFFEYYQSIKKN